MKTLDQVGTRSTAFETETSLHNYALGMTRLARDLHGLRNSLDTYGPVELYDDPQDPLGKVSGLIASLEQIAIEGQRLSGEVDLTSSAGRILALTLRDGATQLSQQLQQLTPVLIGHLNLQTRRSLEGQVANRSTNQ